MIVREPCCQNGLKFRLGFIINCPDFIVFWNHPFWLVPSSMRFWGPRQNTPWCRPFRDQNGTGFREDAGNYIVELYPFCCLVSVVYDWYHPFCFPFLWLNGIRTCVSRNSLGEVARGLWFASSLGTTNSIRFRVYTSPTNNKNPFLQKRSVDRAFDISFWFILLIIHLYLHNVKIS